MNSTPGHNSRPVWENLLTFDRDEEEDQQVCHMQERELSLTGFALPIAIVAICAEK